MYRPEQESEIGDSRQVAENTFRLHQLNERIGLISTTEHLPTPRERLDLSLRGNHHVAEDLPCSVRLLMPGGKVSLY